MEKLTGKDLLGFLARNKTKPIKEKAIEAGYYSQVDERIRANVNAFYKAVIEAEGIPIAGTGDSDDSPQKRGRELSFVTTVQQSGSIVIGAGYTRKMGLNPGDEFEIRLGRKRIYLNPVENESREDDELDTYDEADEEDLVAA